MVSHGFRVRSRHFVRRTRKSFTECRMPRCCQRAYWTCSRKRAQKSARESREWTRMPRRGNELACLFHTRRRTKPWATEDTELRHSYRAQRQGSVHRGNALIQKTQLSSSMAPTRVKCMPTPCGLLLPLCQRRALSLRSVTVYSVIHALVDFSANYSSKLLAPPSPP